MNNLDTYPQTDIQRRKFMEWIGRSSLALAIPEISLWDFRTKSEQLKSGKMQTF